MRYLHACFKGRFRRFQPKAAGLCIRPQTALKRLCIASAVFLQLPEGGKTLIRLPHVFLRRPFLGRAAVPEAVTHPQPGFAVKGSAREFILQTEFSRLNGRRSLRRA